MTESPRRNILGMNLLFVNAVPFLPFRGTYVHTSWTFSITMFMCRSKALTLPSNFLLLRRAIKTSLFALTDLVNREKGPTLKFYYWTFGFSAYINSYNYAIEYELNRWGPLSCSPQSTTFPIQLITEITRNGELANFTNTFQLRKQYDQLEREYIEDQRLRK